MLYKHIQVFFFLMIGWPCNVVITLVDLQLDAQTSYLFTYNTFIKILYMFRVLPCSSSWGLRRNCTYAVSGIVSLASVRTSERTCQRGNHGKNSVSFAVREICGGQSGNRTEYHYQDDTHDKDITCVGIQLEGTSEGWKKIFNLLAPEFTFKF
jgi:hypothetical protein